MELNSTEVEKINMTALQSKLEDIGFNVTQISYSYYLKNWTQNQSREDIPETLIVISPKNKNLTGSKDSFDIRYAPATISRDDESEKDNITAYIKMRANEVATICNLTLDWNKATWGWGYEP
jgi:hypothetical protein